MDSPTVSSRAPASAGRPRVEPCTSIAVLRSSAGSWRPWGPRLLDEGNLAREIVVHEGPCLVLHLVQARDLLGRQDFLEARQVLAHQRHVVALERQVVV